MYNFCISLKKRIKDFMMAKNTLIAAYTANTNPAILTLDDSKNFNIVWGMKNFPQILIFPDPSNPFAHYRAKIKAVDKDTEKITLVDPISVNLPIGTIVKRAPSYVEIQDVILGDPTVIPAYPAITIEPSSRSHEWQTLLTTKESSVINFMVHVLEDNTENAVLAGVRITEDLVDLLNADLHIKLDEMDKTPPDYPTAYNRPYNSLVRDVQYGHTNKGAFLRSSLISWNAETHLLRMIAARYPNIDDFV